jgi:phosphopantetheinyl transferase (holo-ACP synthase)
VHLEGAALNLAVKLGLGRLHVSLSHEADLVVACIVIDSKRE